MSSLTSALDERLWPLVDDLVARWDWPGWRSRWVVPRCHLKVRTSGLPAPPTSKNEPLMPLC